MKMTKLFLVLLLTLSLTSCGVPQHEYDYLRDEYESLFRDNEYYEQELEALGEEIRSHKEELDYYRKMCADLGLLTYDDLNECPYYICDELYHFDYFCSRVSTEKPDFQRRCDWSELRDNPCPECASEIGINHRLYDPQTNIAHDYTIYYLLCETVTQGTEDYRTLIQPLESVYLPPARALELDCTLCPVCSSAEK